ncbi:MAG: hypothetical protein ACP5R6_03840 [Chlorobaculum sp.]
MQVGKYFLMFALLFLWLFRLRLCGYGVKLGVVAVLFLCFYIMILLYSAIVSTYAGNINHFESFFLFLLGIPYLIVGGKGFDKVLVNIVDWFIVINAAFFLVEWLLFLISGRLPALAVKDSFNVRFGGLWDDPNGMGIFMSFILPYIYFRGRGWFMVVLFFINFIALLTTQSMTAIAMFFVGVFLLQIVIYLSKGVSERFFSFGLTVAFSFVAFFVFLLLFIYGHYSIFVRYMAFKQVSSIGGHLNSLSILKNISFGAFLGFMPSGYFGESGYVNIVVNFGLFVLLFVLAFMFLALYAAIKLRYFPVALFMLVFMMSMVNLPLLNVFPVNLIYVLFSFMAIIDYYDISFMVKR